MQFNQRLAGQRAAGLDRAVALEVNEGVFQQASEDPVDPAGVESELGETHLQLGDVVAAQIRMVEVEESLAEAPTGLDQSRPGRSVGLPSDWQASRPLERLDDRDRPVTEGVSGVARR